ncbi:uncharacterized protein LOC133744958 [Rosa rugosa]|uniref:uncharacterized protein LOC133744958 n=1 Tax=Rosa rugosa TaxID=74645 RepID=UPI002B415737|nr:uncharacterized protein LOC133744958 [Rosa rugosa]
MDILSWNCRGICNDTTTRVLKDLISQNKPQIVFLCETKISKMEAFKLLHQALGFPNSKEVLSDAQAGGLAIFWSAKINLQVRTRSAHHIDAVIQGGPGEPRWRMTGFYGYARTVEHDRSWQLLKYLGDSDSLPWVIIGDFNEILNNGEKIDGPPRAERQIRGFREALGYCDLLDLGFQGSRATWWNAETHLRLDHAVCTPSWLDVFGYAKVTHLPPSDSDHIPILLQASEVPIPKRPKHQRFKFESFWLQHKDCDPLVKTSWQAEVSGVPMFQVVKKIAHTRIALDKWQKNTFRLRQQQMLGVRARLAELLNSSATTSIQDEKRILMNRLETLFSQEEAFWRQRAKVDGVEHIVTSYFTKMFTASPVDMEAMNTILEAIQPSVTPTMNDQLCSEYTEEEIRCALFQMYPTKSLGPDGMPPLFFQHYWEVNFTHICLIPKVNNPESMSDLRPIALCNVIYKICSKAIANRLKVLLPDIISPFQSAFVPGRLITDNILVANEIAHFVHNKKEGNDGHLALKLDLSKAYDRMEWLFLRKVMERFGFTWMWIELVMQCVCSVQFSFLIRGKPRGLVTPSRGLRQGDPLSPYLFLLGVEGFSALLQQKQRLGLLPGIQGEIASYKGVEVVDSHERYLGLPTYVGRKKTATFQYIKDNLAKKLKNWQGKMLSGACKDILIRVVAQALPTYAMSVFQLTTNFFCEDLEQMCARFWWGSTEDKRKIHWKAWGSLCHPKEEGGLSFRSLTEFNMAMLAKQAWRIANDHESLIAIVYKARYFPGSSFWLAPVHSAPSYSWRSIFAARELLKAGTYWQIGTGKYVKVWSDNWVPGISTLVPNIGLPLVNENMTEGAEAILNIPLSRRLVNDRVAWRLEKKGEFSVKTAYRYAFSTSLERPGILENVTSQFWKKIWQANIPSSAKVHVWKVCHNILPTLTRLVAKHVVIESQLCVLCIGMMESTLHLCRDCPFSREVLCSNSSIAQVCFTTESADLGVLEWLIFCSNRLAANQFDFLLFLLWGVWKERNCRVWEGKTRGVNDVVLMSVSRLQDFVSHNSRSIGGIRRDAGRICWKSPHLGSVKLNTDGAFISETSAGGIGLVMRDNLGQFLACEGKPVRGLLSAEHAELLACKATIDLIVDRSLQPAIVETDSLIVQQQLVGVGNNLSRLGRIYEDLKLQLDARPNVKVIHTRREANVAAHLTAAQALSSGQTFYCSSTPSFLHDVIASEYCNS